MKKTIFTIEEQKNTLENLQVGLSNYKHEASRMDKNTPTTKIMKLYANLGVLIYRANQVDLSKEIVYPSQDIQKDLEYIMFYK
jgi:hypothetical protein